MAKYTSTVIAGVHLMDDQPTEISNQVGGYEMLVDTTRTSSAGVRVNSTTILEYAPIWYSVCKMGGHIGTMPKRVKITRNGTVEDVTTQRSGLPDLLNLQPSNFMNSHDLFETAQKDAVIDGNARIGIIRDEKTKVPTTLILINPSDAWSFISYPGGLSGTISETHPTGPVFGGAMLWHHVTAASGETFILNDADCMYVKGLQTDGLSGIPLWSVGRDSIGGGLAAEKHVNRTMTNAGIPGLILTAPEGVLNDTDKANEFLDSFRRRMEGNTNAGKTALLRYGVTASQVSQSGRDGQLIENRQFSRDEAWMWTGDMLFYEGGPTYSNTQERDDAYKQHTLSRWISKWESEMNIKLLSLQQRQRGWFIDMDQDAILRGTLKARLEADEIARRIGYLSQEEIRARDGLPPPDPEHNFQNPNTSSPVAAPAAEEPAPVETDGGTDGAADDDAPQARVIPQLKLEGPTRAERIAQTRLSGWFRQERARLLDFAENPTTFQEKTEAFYEKNAAKLETICQELGVESWQNESFNLALFASECQPSELLDRIDDLTRNWPTERAALIAGEINDG